MISPRTIVRRTRNSRSDDESANSSGSNHRALPNAFLSGRRRRPLGLASVRRSNGSYSFPVSRFHKGVSSKVQGRNEWTFLSPAGLSRSSEQVSSGHDVRVFHSRNLSASWPLLTHSPSRTDHLCQPTSPAHPAAARAVTRLSPGLKYYSVVRLLAAHPFPLRLSAYRVRYPGATREHDEPSWGHVQIFRTVPLANTLVRRVGKNAFAAIVPARPCPVFGRPIHHRAAPSITARYFSASPSDSTSRWTPCPPVAFRQ